MSSESPDFKREEELERLLLLANLQRMRKQWVEATDTAKKAIELAPEDAGIREILGDIYFERGMLSEAVAEYKSAMDLEPGKPALEKKFAVATLQLAEGKREHDIAEGLLTDSYSAPVKPKSPWLALLASGIFPGLGQLYNGEMVKALVLIAVSFISLMCAFSLPPFWFALGFLWIYSTIDAPVTAFRISKKASEKSVQTKVSDLPDL